MAEYIKRESAIDAVLDVFYDTTDIDLSGEKLEAAILNVQAADVEPVHEWISVKEHIPQENDPEGTVCELVQVLLVNGDVSTGWCNRRTKLWWHFSYGESDFIYYDYDNTPVIAWQPLAQPPKGE